ncbi:TNF receptor-associated factor family protein DDB_G0272340-like isoform X3 [Actinia tenebrosa]|uniref:TNF receptor-associated factor family protein DDB_G0272340-like isoform X3 n=1 Tax=Actinia tenebrosa TaxID=6105 RepID=A0A6P8J5K2_ACTTE|nr:TNF receptor-associated factor family protein DDB_G0272340-like isoform X3 [Actinia tenebrosa]
MMGFETKLFVRSVDKNLICAICHEVFNDPYGCKDGHSFCKDCITTWLETQERCPLDNKRVQGKDLVRNLVADNMIHKLEVWCDPPEINEGAGRTVESPVRKCQWRGELQSLAKHKEDCLFQHVQCPNENCKETIQRKDMDDHDTKCEHKVMKCNKCRKQLLRHQLEDHSANECPETLIPCPNNCIEQGQIQEIKRVDLDHHLKNICAKTILECPFKENGCLAQVERQHVDKHVQDNMAAHIFLLGKKCSGLTKENQLLKDELKNVKEEFHNQLLGNSSYTWVVRNYPNLANNPIGSRIGSPPFWLRGYKWCISLYPNGNSAADATGFVSLYLRKVEEDSQSFTNTMPNTSNNEVAIPYRLTVISQKPGTDDDVSYQSIRVFTKERNNRGKHKLMKSSDALSPSYCNNGRLIIQCTILPTKLQ